MQIELLLTLMVVVYTTGVVFKRLDLPILLGELLAGLIVGPSFLGWVEYSESIKTLAELGVFFLALHAGLDTEPRELLKGTKSAIFIGVISLAAPLFVAYGICVAAGLSHLQGIFIGLAIAITSVSSVIKIFKGFKLQKTKVAQVVMGAALIQEILGFIVLSAILAFAEQNTLSWWQLAEVLLKTGLFFVVTIFLGQKILPLMSRLVNKKKVKVFTFTLIVALFFALLAEKIGLHFIVGAFLAGVFVKEEIGASPLYNKIEDRIFALSYSFLGPIFFITLGFDVDLGIFFHSWEVTILAFALIFVAGILAKIFSAALPYYFFNKGEGKKQAILVGLGMNGRGAVDLIIASIGLEMGLIGKDVFSILMMVTFVAIVISTIFLKVIISRERRYLHQVGETD